MRNIIYFIICVACIVVVAYMGYEGWMLIQASGFTLHNVAWLFGTFGWLLITYKIVMKDYNWTKKFFR